MSSTTFTESPCENWNEFCEVFPGGVNSPVRSFPGMDVTPLVLGEGYGAHFIDTSGRRFLDFCCSWGANLVGHAHPKVVDAVSRRAARGTSFGITCEEELQLARKVQTFFPSMEMLRWVNSGTEACMTALRIARGATGKNKIVKFVGHYHGHSDSLLVQAGSGVWGLNATSSSAGVPDSFIEHTLLVPFNDPQALENLINRCDDIAAVIIEPVSGNMGCVPPEVGFLEFVRKITLERGIILIFDEVMTGFRVALGGAQEYWSITPDLTCLGKVVGGGFPVAAVGGKRYLMEHLAPLGSVYQAGTLSGNPVGMAAGLAALSLMETGEWQALHRRVDHFALRMEAIIHSKRAQGLQGCFQRAGLMFNLFIGPEQVRSHFDLEAVDIQAYQRLFRALLEQGIYLPPSPFEAWFVSFAHSEEDLERCAVAIDEAWL